MSKKTVVLALQHLGVDNLYYIPPAFEVDGVWVMTHHNPVVRLIDNKPVCNAHVCVEFLNPNLISDPLMEVAFDGNYQVVRRLPKSRQVALIERDKARDPKSPLHRLDIPATMGSHISAHSGQYLMRKLDEVGTVLSPEDLRVVDRVVVKPENGAKGKGQAVVSLDDVRFLMDNLSLPIKALRERFPDALFTDPDPNQQDDVEDEEDMCLFMNNDYVVTEYKDNIVAEYRVLVGGDVIYMAERERTSGAFPQANLNNKKRNGRTFTKIDVAHDLHSLIQAIVDSQGLLLGSIDLYRTDDNEVGFFECCPQFGTYATSPEVAHQIHVGFVRKVIQSHLDSV